MGLVAVLATVILLATILTLVFAFASYFVSRAKRRIKKKEDVDPADGAVSPRRTYFGRYFPGEGAGFSPEPPVRESDREKDSQWI